MSSIIDTYFYDRNRKCEFVMTVDRGVVTAKQIRPGNSTLRTFKRTKRGWNVPRDWSDCEYVEKVLSGMATSLVRCGHIPGGAK